MQVKDESAWEALQTSARANGDVAEEMVDFLREWTERAEGLLPDATPWDSLVQSLGLLQSLVGEISAEDRHRQHDLVGPVLLLLIQFWKPVADDPESFLSSLNPIEQAFMHLVSKQWIDAKLRAEQARADAEEFAANASV